MEEEKYYKVILATVTKCVGIISVAGILMFWGYSCRLDPNIIQECKSACSSSDSQMKEVTRTECVCEEKSSHGWVMPRK